MRSTWVPVLLSVVACETGGYPVRTPPDTVPTTDDPGSTDTDPGTDTDTDPPTDTAPTDTDTGDGPPPELVEVSHDRELRGVWIATVSNINWPTAQGQPIATQQADLVDLLDVCVDAGLNAVFFQVRPEADALYASNVEPWSRYLTGTQGNDPGWDPLQFLLDEAHARGIEVHAWLNPYRAKASASSIADPDHASVVYAQYAHTYGSLVWLDPGAPAIQDHLEAVIVDLVTNYDVDGVHFDDYFYPYPNGTAFPDSATYAAYGGGLSLADWRRDNVNQMMSRVSAAIAALDPAVRFGIAPFGIYRPGQPPGIVGLDQYAELYADPVLWKASGWVDYLAPQLYWPTTQTAQAYEPLLDWWSELPEDGRYTFIGNALYQLGTTSAWTVDEFRDQVDLTRGRTDANALGNIWYNITNLENDTDGIRGVFRDEFYATPALPPPVFDLQDEAVDPPTVAVVDADTVAVSHADAKAWVVYLEGADGFAIDRIVPATESELLLGPGRWAVTAAARHDVESLGVVIEL